MLSVALAVTNILTSFGVLDDYCEYYCGYSVPLCIFFRLRNVNIRQYWAFDDGLCRGLGRDAVGGTSIYAFEHRARTVLPFHAIQEPAGSRTKPQECGNLIAGLLEGMFQYPIELIGDLWEP